MKTLTLTALGVVGFVLMLGVGDLEASTNAASVGVSAVVKERCAPVATNVGAGASSVVGTPDAVWVRSGMTSESTVVAAATKDQARVKVCRVPFHQVVAPATNQGDLVVTITY